MLGDFEQIGLLSDFMNTDLDLSDFPSTIYFPDEDDHKDGEADNGQGLGIKPEEPISSSYGHMPTQAMAIPKKRPSGSLDMTGSSFEDHNASHYQQLYGSPNQFSPRSDKMRKITKGSPGGYEEYPYLPPTFSQDGNGDLEAIDYQAPLITQRKRTASDCEMAEKLDTCSSSIDSDFLNITTDKSCGKRIRAKFKAQPPSNIRPSYPNCEGSRGVIKTENGDNVELVVNSGWPEDMELILATVIVTPPEDGNFTAKSHPHFKAYTVGENVGKEFTINEGILALGSQRKLSAGESSLPSISAGALNLPHTTAYFTQSKIPMTQEIHTRKSETAVVHPIAYVGEPIHNVDVGIMRLKKGANRTSRLQRAGHILFLLCVLRKLNSGEWEMVDFAQVVTDAVDIDQPQGAPCITNISHSRCGYTGGINIAVKGRNLQGKNDECVVVTFVDSKKKWKGEAQTFKDVTTKESLLIQVPPYPLEKCYGQEPYPAEVKVSIHIKVGKRDTEKGTSFTYHSEGTASQGRSTLGEQSHLVNYLRAPHRGTCKSMSTSSIADEGLTDLKDVADVLNQAEGVPPLTTWLDMPPSGSDMALFPDPIFPPGTTQTLSSGYLPGDSVTSLQENVAAVHLQEGLPANQNVNCLPFGGSYNMQ